MTRNTNIALTLLIILVGAAIGVVGGLLGRISFAALIGPTNGGDEQGFFLLYVLVGALIFGIMIIPALVTRRRKKE